MDTDEYELPIREGTGEEGIANRLKKRKAKLQAKHAKLERQKAETEQREADLARLQRENEEEGRVAASASLQELSKFATDALTDLIAAEKLSDEVADRIVVGTRCSEDRDIFVSGPALPGGEGRRMSVYQWAEMIRDQKRRGGLGLFWGFEKGGKSHSATAVAQWNSEFSPKKLMTEHFFVRLLEITPGAAVVPQLGELGTRLGLSLIFRNERIVGVQMEPSEDGELTMPRLLALFKIARREHNVNETTVKNYLDVLAHGNGTRAKYKIVRFDEGTPNDENESGTGVPWFGADKRNKTCGFRFFLKSEVM